MERLELELSAATPDTGVLEQLEESLREAQEAEVFERGQLEDIMAQRIKLSDLSREQMRSKVAAQREIEQSEMELDKLSKNAEKLKAKREQALREKNAALEEVQEAENTKKQWEERRGQAQANLTRDLAMAEQICPRVEVPRGETYASLDKKRQRLARERAESERE